MKTKFNFMKKLMLFTAAFAFCAVLCAKPMDVKAAAVAPTDLAQTDASTSSVTVEWTQSLSVDYYEVQISETGAAGSYVSKTTYASDYRTISGLAAGKTYWVQVRACSPEYSNWVTLKVDTAPNNITTLTQTNAAKNSVTYSWSPVSGATGYLLYKALPSDSAWTQIGTTASTSYTLTVPANSEYDVAVLPYRNAANSKIYVAYPTSYPKSITCVSAPTAPNGLDIVGGNPKSNTYKFYWEPTSVYDNTDGYEIEVYQMKTNGKTTRLKKATKSGFGYGSSSSGYYSYTEIKNAKLTTNASRFRVRAYVQLSNGKKIYSPWSSYKNYVPQAKQTKLTVHTKTSGTLKWKKVTGATSYDIYYKTSSSDNAKWKRIKKNVKGTSASVKVNYYGRSYYYVKSNKVKFGKKKLNSVAPLKAPFWTYWY